jgi:alpha-galactosidase
MTFDTIDELDVDPAAARFYAEGWQSWSPTTWASWGRPHRPDEPWQHTMRFRPGRPLPDDDTIQGEGLLVVDPGSGEPTRIYAIEHAGEEVATIRASLTGTSLVVAADGPVVRAFADDPVTALTTFGDDFAAGAGVQELRPAPRVWCSWYRYFEAITAPDVEENLAAFDEHDLAVDVVQVDDGWSLGLGEGLRPSRGFADLAGLVDRVRSTGRRVGIWLAPFTIGADTELARRQPAWVTGDAGRNWGQQLLGLDLTHPEVREYLFTAVRGLAELGIDYFKLDFLYAGAVPGRRHDDTTGVAAYRSGVELVRAAAGPDAFLLGCGAPILPSVGRFDAMRVSPDTFHEGGEDGSGGLRGRMPLVARSWQQGRFWVNDPDCLVTRPSYGQRERWAEAFAEFGGLRSFSDRVSELDEWGLETTRRLMADAPAPGPFPVSTLERSLDATGAAR